MPITITEELKNVKKFESVGFSHEQAETLAETLEEAQASGQENLKEFIRNEFDKQTKDFVIKLHSLEAKIMASQKDMLIKIFGIVAGCITVAITILKLFP